MSKRLNGKVAKLEARRQARRDKQHARAVFAAAPLNYNQGRK